MRTPPLFSRLLQLLLALVLGLGPLGASVLAASLHAPLCGCAGCGATTADESCCPVGANEEEGPLVRAAQGSCGCQLVEPDTERSQPALTCPCPVRERSGDVPARRGLELCATPLVLRVAPRDSYPPGRASPPGPAGGQRLRGAARAAALGLMLL